MSEDIPTFAVGQRVRLIRDVEVYPIDIFRAGLTGTVTDFNPGMRPIMHVKLDRHFGGLKDWDNELQVWPDGHDGSNSTLDAFEKVAP
jgi:hypothetical protein